MTSQTFTDVLPFVAPAAPPIEHVPTYAAAAPAKAATSPTPDPIPHQLLVRCEARAFYLPPPVHSILFLGGVSHSTPVIDSITVRFDLTTLAFIPCRVPLPLFTTATYNDHRHRFIHQLPLSGSGSGGGAGSDGSLLVIQPSASTLATQCTVYYLPYDRLVAMVMQPVAKELTVASTSITATTQQRADDTAMAAREWIELASLPVASTTIIGMTLI